MCLIIDVNTLHKVFPTPTADYEPVAKAVADGKAKIFYGGELAREYMAMERFRRYLRMLDQKGSAQIFPVAEVDAKAEELEERDCCRSDDPHVLALALVSGARLLCSEDNDLCDDFKDSHIIAKPRGKIFRNATHAHLLRRHCTNQAGA
jgi:hypothetical protein